MPSDVEMAPSSQTDRSSSNTPHRTVLECKNLTYMIGNATILDGIDCCFSSGRCVALMGPSGAGKTTLLNILSARSKIGNISSGSVTLNGSPVTQELMRTQCKVVPQQDQLIPVLTARESLLYTAALCINDTLGNRTKRVDGVLEMLSISDCADVLCGGEEFKGLSGGQRKRVSIGMELLADPSCLLLDEPTSGLDSKVAEDVVGVIRRLARDGRNIICTIHQPSFQVFSKFDSLLLLERGRIAYCGRVDRLSAYLDEIRRPCPQFINPADHIMQVLAEPGDSPKQFAGSSFCVEARDDGVKNSWRGDAMAFFKGESYPTSFGAQAATIWRRSLDITRKDKRQAKVRVVQVCFIGILVGSIYWRMENSQVRVQDKLSVIFLIILALSMSSIMSTALTLPVEKAMLTREYANGYYSIFAYFSARISVLMLFQIFYSVLLVLVSYFSVGLRDNAESFFVFAAVVAILSVLAGTFGFTAGVVVANPQQAVAAVPMIIMPLVIFAGLFIPLDNIPVYWVWLYYISFFQYGLQIAMVNEFDGAYLDACTVEEVVNPTGLCPYGPCNSQNFTNPMPCPGSVVLSRFDYDPADTGRNFAILAGYIVLMLCISFWSLKRLVKSL